MINAISNDKQNKKNLKNKYITKSKNPKNNQRSDSEITTITK